MSGKLNHFINKIMPSMTNINEIMNYIELKLIEEGIISIKSKLPFFDSVKDFVDKNIVKLGDTKFMLNFNQYILQFVLDSRYFFPKLYDHIDNYYSM